MSDEEKHEDQGGGKKKQADEDGRKFTIDNYRRRK
jgi:hypothetical protein